MEGVSYHEGARPGSGRTVTGREFRAAFAEGLACLGYERDEHGNGKFLLGPWDEKH